MEVIMGKNNLTQVLNVENKHFKLCNFVQPNKLTVMQAKNCKFEDCNLINCIFDDSNEIINCNTAQIENTFNESGDLISTKIYNKDGSLIREDTY